MVKQTLLILVVAGLAIACGGTKPKTTTSDDGNQVTEPPPGDPAMVSVEQMDEIQRMFVRKATAVSRCLSVAVDNKELPRSSRGKVTLGVVIATSGRPSDVKIIKASLESKTLNECVVNKVKEIQFPAIPTSYETTYTYAFEAS